MGDLQATIEFLVELYKFYNVDLFIRGYYQFRLTFKPPKSSHAIQVEVCEGHGERGAFTLFPAFLTNDDQTAVSRTFNIYYKDEEVLLKDVFLFRVHLLIDSTKAADCIDKAALEMTVDVHFTDQVVRENNYRILPLVTSRTLKFHFSCFNGLHHQVPLLFDYYYFSVLDMIVHANVISLGLPNWSILKQIKTGWFSKSATIPRSSTPLFYTSLFGNRSQFGMQFYSDVSLRYAVTNSISRESFEKASAIHRNLCAILAMAHSQLLNYFDEMMQYLDEKQRIKLGEKLDPADLVEGLCKKLETLQSCEEVFDEMCSDLSVLNNELALLWLQFQESFILNDKIRPLLREQHHHERIMHFSEAFFVHELPWKSLLNVTDSSFQKYVGMGQCVKSSRYLAMIPPVTIECAEVDGDSTTTPIFFEDRYVNRTGKSLENFCAVQVPGGIEEDVLEHKPLAFGILNKAFNDLSPQVTDSADSTDFDLDTKDLWVDIKTAQENDVIVARGTHAGEDTTENECKVTEDIEGDDEGQERKDCIFEGHSAISPNSENRSIVDTFVKRTDRNNSRITNLELSRKLSADCSKEASISTSPKTLLEFSLENTTSNMETPEEENDHFKDSQGHCETMQDTNEREVGDLSDIRVIIGSTGDQQNRKPETEMESFIDRLVNSAWQESKLDAGRAVTLNEGIGTKDISVLSEGTQENDISSGNNEGCLESSEDQSEATDTQSPGNEPPTLNCLISICDSETTVKKSEEADDDSQLAKGKEVAILEEVVKSNTSVQDVSSSRIVVRYSPGEEINKNRSSVQYIGSNDTTTGDCSKVGTKNGSCISEQRTSSKTGQSDGQDTSSQGELVTGIKTGFKQGEPENMSQVDEPGKDQCTSTGKDNANNTNKLCCGSDETMSLTTSEKRTETEAIIKEPGCNDIVTNSSNPTPIDNSLKSGVSTSTTKENSDKGFKVRNTPHANSAKRVNNSVFYEGINYEENCSEQGLQNKEISNTQLYTVKLSSNSSSDGISCFCGGQLKKTSSPYRPTSESDTSNLKLQKAKQDVRSRMNYCGTLYGDSTTEFVVKPYFMNPKPDLSLEPVHFVVCVHGLDGNSGDLRLLRCFLEMALPSTKFEFLMSEVNQDNTFATFEKQTDKLVSEILHHMEAYRMSPSRISFIGHSLGNIIIRSALNHPLMEPYVELFHTFLSLSGPHLGMVHHTSSLVSTGMWLLQKWKKSDSLLQLSLNDSTDMRDTFIYKLSKKKGLEYFTNVLLVSSVQDHYAPFHSSRIELPKSLRSNSQEYIVYREMMENLLTPLLNQPNRSLVRYSVYHCLPSSTNTFIGRAAHIAMLDSELFIEKLICTSAAKYFQ